MNDLLFTQSHFAQSLSHPRRATELFDFHPDAGADPIERAKTTSYRVIKTDNGFMSCFHHASLLWQGLLPSTKPPLPTTHPFLALFR